MKYFSYFKDKDSGFIYTVDMVRLSCYILKKDASALLFLLQNNFEEYWQDDSYGKYSQNFKFENLWIGLGTKTKQDKDFILFTVEFNPNKLSSDAWEKFYFLDKIVLHKWILRRFDLAVDIPYPINDLKFYSVGKKSYSVFYKDFNDKTFYFGKGNGRIKVYNKTIESDLDYDLTRFELTKECNCLIDSIPNFDFLFPEVNFQEFISSEKNDTLDAIQYSLNHGFPFSSLSRCYKSFFKKDLVLNGKIKEDLCNKALDEFFKIFNTPRF